MTGFIVLLCSYEWCVSVLSSKQKARRNVDRGFVQMASVVEAARDGSWCYIRTAYAAVLWLVGDFLVCIVIDAEAIRLLG